MMCYWLDKGVDGFWMDVIFFISKRLEWFKVDWNDFFKIVEEVYVNGFCFYEFLQEMNIQVLVFYDIIIVGEVFGVLF